MRLGRARKDSLWLCYARPFAGRQKSGISGSKQRLKPTAWGETVGKTKRGGRTVGNRTKKIIHTLRVRFRRERRVGCLPCLSRGDDRQGMPGTGDVSLLILITSMSGSKSLRSFTNCFHFNGPPGLRLSFDAAERKGKLATFSDRKIEISSRGKRKRRVFLCRRTVRVKVKGKVIPMSFLKIEERGTFVGQSSGEIVTVSGIGR